MRGVVVTGAMDPSLAVTDGVRLSWSNSPTVDLLDVHGGQVVTSSEVPSVDKPLDSGWLIAKGPAGVTERVDIQTGADVLLRELEHLTDAARCRGYVTKGQRGFAAVPPPVVVQTVLEEWRVNFRFGFAPEGVDRLPSP
jgi:hypothetical protein